MSWNAHTDHIFNQCDSQLQYLLLTGPDGSAWGSSGTTTTPFSATCITSAVKTPTSGVVAGIKFMYLRSVDPGLHVFNKAGKGLALLVGTSYVAVALSADGYKAEQCVTALEKLKAYLGTIGYN